jgi:hypothetical protein
VGIVVATTFGLVVWLVMWALGIKALDSFLITLAVVVVAAAVKIVAPNLPGNRDG